jgi:hypothetical protein
MYLYILRFNIKSKQHTFIKKYLTAQEIQAAKKERQTERLDNNIFNLISDTNEDLLTKNSLSQPLNIITLRKRFLRDIRDIPPIKLEDKDKDVEIDKIPLSDNINMQSKGNI